MICFGCFVGFGRDIVSLITVLMLLGRFRILSCMCLLNRPAVELISPSWDVLCVVY